MTTDVKPKQLNALALLAHKLLSVTGNLHDTASACSGSC